MDPVLSSPQLEFMMTETDSVLRIAEILWRNLELTSVSVTCVSLLHRLISLARVGEVETVVATSLSLTTHSPAQYERFARLWHLSRDVNTNRSAVDLCTMKMISGLQSRRGAVRAVCSRWVEQCVARGDCGRMVEPLLLSLLDTSTARVSVLHAGVTRHGHVYKIRCGDNKVVYHGKTWPTNSLMLSNASISNYSRYLVPQEDTPKVQKNFPYGNSELWVNPFALVSSESEYNQDPGVSPEPDHDTRDTSRASSPTSETRDTEHTSPRRSLSVVTSLLSELISQAVDTSCYVLDLTQFTFPSMSPRDSDVSISDHDDQALLIDRGVHPKILCHVH